MARRPKSPPKPLDSQRLGEIALHYVARYATSSGKLAAYLARKIRERGWDDTADPAAAVEAHVTRMLELRYIDDEGFAEQRAGSLTRRGYGARRVADQLRADGSPEPVRKEAVRVIAEPDQALAAALTLARRRRVGPYAVDGRVPVDETPDARRKAYARDLGAFLRAGHSSEVARRVLAMGPGGLDDAGALVGDDD